MKVRFCCAYYSDKAKGIAKRPEDYWDAYFYVWAVKVGSFKKSFYIHATDGKLNVTAKNFEVVRRSFGKYIARCLERDFPNADWVVPVPSKDAIVGTQTSRAQKMAVESLAATPHAGKAHASVLWTKKLDPAHEGGARLRANLKPHLHVDGNVKGRSVVLVDDLLSRGGSLLAVKEALEEAGANVLGAVVCGKTVYDFDVKPFGDNEFELTEELADYAVALLKGAPA